MKSNYTSVSELPGEIVPVEQYLRIAQRYHWAAKHCNGKDVLECACGAGQGSKLLKSISKSYTAGDYDQELIDIAEQQNSDIQFLKFDASKMPFETGSFDIVLVCEAIYYFDDIKKFLNEVYRVLRVCGKILIVSANPNLYDFNPGKWTFTYPDVVSIEKYFNDCDFEILSVEGGISVSSINIRQKLLRPIKFLASKLNIMPQTMNGKAWLKKLFYGGERIKMPASIELVHNLVEPSSLELGINDTKHKVLFFIGEKK